MGNPADPADEVERLWLQLRHVADERISVLEDALSAARADRLGAEQLLAAQRAAHNLAGSLGSFRRPAGSEAAAEAEMALTGPPDLARLDDAIRRIRAAVSTGPTR
ncbi:Hpt domain-containing protein [Mycobacterium sp. Y57]|uniref:Hpt domain-containing protein n=1 Tax=Mycolicibacterium xanthum TaxID=2796469 RepID=UPI001C846636|nr:Hpt domain-containing protein [Mycolicibacterium xanthum]MBX7435475.1 Hpt domain-containing protein [Mycolicibacterium xanthum]